CVVDARGLPRLDDLEAVDPASGVEALPQGTLCAVTSQVHLAAFGEEPLKQHLEDLAWLERVARVHDAVLARLLDAGSVVPFRLFTIFTTEERVREMLERERERLRAELDRLRGRYEWSVKVLADREQVEESARARGAVRAGADGVAERPGHSYLARKMHARDLHEVARDLVDAAMEETQARLGRRAADLTLLPLQSAKISG